MRSIRLLPVVIFAALALLLFKGIGLVTNGGYVLTGPAAVVAQDAAADDNSLSLPSEATATDTSPTLGDTAPTLPATPDPAAASRTSSSSAEAASSALASSSSAEVSSSASSSAEQANVCPDVSSSAQPAGNELTDKIGNALAKGCPPPNIPVNAAGDALPTVKDGNGHIVPLQVVDGDNSEQALLQRLSERRTELDKREADLQMRTALVEAAEKRLDDKTKALEALQAQVNALVDEKQATEDAGFKSVVSMYETMKAKDAARIFDTLDLGVLLRVARAMNPRQLAPILAAMSQQPAEQLTTAMASTISTNVVPTNSAENLAALPQIVGQ